MVPFNPSGRRLLAVDSMRGIAATMVAVYHFYNALGGKTNVASVPDVVDAVLKYADSGVHIFFVLSGLVVFLNLAQYEAVGLPFLARFVLRRSIRLDPPYWLVIGLSIVASAVAGRMYADGWPGVLANMLYLYNLVEIRPIVTVGWTLCLELQFYVLLAVGLVVADKLRTARLSRAFVLAMIISPTLLWSLLIAGGWATNPLHGLFLTHWHLFLLGTAVGLLMCQERLAAAIVGVGAVVAAVLEFRHVGPLVALATAAVIWALHRRGRLVDPLGGRPLQYLGKISYSFYLVHPLIGNRGCRWMVSHFPEASKSLWFMAAGMVGATILSLIVAHVVWRFVEYPAQEFARRKVKLAGLGPRDVRATEPLTAPAIEP